MILMAVVVKQYTIFLHSRTEKDNFRLAQRPESDTFWA